MLCSNICNHYSGVEAELREKICSLEHSIEEHEKQKKRLLHEFDKFKSDCADHESQVTSANNQKIATLSKELQNYQIEFEQKATAFEKLIATFEHDSDETVEDLKKAHQIEISNLIKTQQSHSSTRELELAKELESARLRYTSEIERLSNAHSELKDAKAELEKDYEENFKKSKALYEKELEILQQNQSEIHSSKHKLLQEQIDKLTKDFRFQEAQYRQRIDTLLNDLSASEDTINDLKTKNASLNTENSSISSERVSLNSQV